MFNLSLNLQALLISLFVAFFLFFQLHPAKMTKRQLITDYCYLCKHLISLNPITNSAIFSNDNEILEDSIESEEQIRHEILEMKRQRLKFAFNRLSEKIDSKAPYPFSDHISAKNLSLVLKDFDYKQVKFERERVVYVYDDTFPIKIFQGLLKSAGISGINKKYLNQFNI